MGDGQIHYGQFPGCAAPDVFAETGVKPVSNPTSCC